MKIRCPECGTLVDLERAASDAHFHDLIKVLRDLGPKARLVSEYVDGFRTKRTSALAAKKYLRLVKEVMEIIETGKFVYDGREYKAGPDVMEEALREVCNRDLVGLKNHNYLKQVLRGTIEKKQAQHEARLQNPYRELKPNVSEIRIPEDTVSTDEIKKFRKNLSKIGKEMS